jgi:uncharacterized protein YjbI with pentapeptide repeats
MAHEDLWQNDAFRKAFQRWWDEDWSWSGLAEKYRLANFGGGPVQKLGSLRNSWRSEAQRLIAFAGRKWTRFHLPPFDRDGNPCPTEFWKAAKDSDCTVELRRRLDSPQWPDETALKERSLDAVTDFADLRGVVFPKEFALKGERLVAHLESAIFLGGPAFDRKRVLAWFVRATFFGDTSFSGATFAGHTSFNDATFSRHASFDRAAFSENVSFDSAKFSGNASFSGATFAGHTSFNGATFSGAARFDGATFSGIAQFEGSTFSKDAWFGGATFSGDARFGPGMLTRLDDDGIHITFRSMTFSGAARFDGATFSGVVTFRATFRKYCSFAGTTPFAKRASFSESSFRNVGFSGREFREATDFSSAHFDGVPKFHGGKLHPDTSFLNATFRYGDPPRRAGWFHDWPVGAEGQKEAKRRLRAWLLWRHVPFGLRHPALKEVRRRHDADAEEYEIAYRQLRRLTAEIGSIEYEGLFHALELRAHRARTDTNPTARFASWLYDVLSDYGRSMGRPVIALFGAWAFFATAYLLLLTPPYSVGGPNIVAETCQNMAWPSRAELWVASAREFLPSLFGMSSVSNRPEWLRCAEGNHPLTFFALSVSQVAAFIACVSLFLIALRRRFQLRD